MSSSLHSGLTERMTSQYCWAGERMLRWHLTEAGLAAVVSLLMTRESKSISGGTSGLTIRVPVKSTVWVPPSCTMFSLPQNWPSTTVPSSMRAISTSSAEATVVSRTTCWPGTSSRLNVAGISVTGGGLKTSQTVCD